MARRPTRTRALKQTAFVRRLREEVGNIAVSLLHGSFGWREGWLDDRGLPSARSCGQENDKNARKDVRICRRMGELSDLRRYNSHPFLYSRRMSTAASGA